MCVLDFSVVFGLIRVHGSFCGF